MYQIYSSVGSYTVIDYDQYVPTTFTMICKTLEEISSESIDFIKIDVEGSEFNIIENSKMLKDIKFIEIEVHPPYGEKMDDFICEYVKNYLAEHRVIDLEGGHVFLKKNEK